MIDEEECEARVTEATTDGLLEELQHAAHLHQQILLRQAELIARLREELKGVMHGDE